MWKAQAVHRLLLVLGDCPEGALRHAARASPAYQHRAGLSLPEAFSASHFRRDRSSVPKPRCRSQKDVILDSNLRLYYGLAIGLGVMVSSVIPAIERHPACFRLVALTIFIGGVGRLVAMLSFGIPTWPFILFTALEIGLPATILLQNRSRRT